MSVSCINIFCYECGCRVVATDNFCPQCGTQLDCSQQQVEKYTPAKYFDIAIPENLRSKSAIGGYILTNIQALADHLHVGYDEIMEILNEFSSLRSAMGVAYRIIDMSRRMANPAKISWIDYQKAVTEYYEKDAARGIAVDYLFIIGGADIVPMPSIPIKVDKEDDIDSDFPYCWLYREGIEQQIENLTIFTSDMKLWCGRLPMAADTTLKDFIKMLSGMLEAGYRGLPNLNLHVQSDPNWKETTTLVASKFKEYMPPLNEHSEHFHGPVMLTPEQHPDTELFDSNFPYHDSSVFYYNLHGGNEPGINKFRGCRIGSDMGNDALYPKHMAAVSNLNAVITEACYGGWFKVTSLRQESKLKNETVLLAAIHASTVCYVGASRIAYGINDKCLSHGAAPQCADVFAREFLQSLYAGYPAGVSLWHARKAFCNRPLEYNELVTVFEFNLFGDPALSVIIRQGIQDCRQQKSALLNEEMRRQSIYEVEYDTTRNNGILGYVRSLVDRNLREINSVITQHLYAQYSVKPRKLNRVLSCNTGNGGCKYVYCYDVDDGEWVVGMDARSGHILYTVCSK